MFSADWTTHVITDGRKIPFCAFKHDLKNLNIYLCCPVNLVSYQLITSWEEKKRKKRGRLTQGLPGVSPLSLYHSQHNIIFLFIHFYLLLFCFVLFFLFMFNYRLLCRPWKPRLTWTPALPSTWPWPNAATTGPNNNNLKMSTVLQECDLMQQRRRALKPEARFTTRGKIPRQLQLTELWRDACQADNLWQVRPSKRMLTLTILH